TWSGTGCSSNCGSLSTTASYFSINNSGQLTLTSSGASSLPLGTTTITVEALNSGGFGLANIIVHYGSDVTPPTVTMTSPSNGATVSGSLVALSATSSDNVAVANVQFEVDGTNIGSAATSSTTVFSTTWDSTGASNGTHTLYAVAKDTSGNYATSSISVTVNNSISYSGAGDLVSGATAWWGLRGYDDTVSNGTTKAINICRASDSTCEDIDVLNNGHLDASSA